MRCGATSAAGNDPRRSRGSKDWRLRVPDGCPSSPVSHPLKLGLNYCWAARGKFSSLSLCLSCFLQRKSGVNCTQQHGMHSDSSRTTAQAISQWQQAHAGTVVATPHLRPPSYTHIYQTTRPSLSHPTGTQRKQHHRSLMPRRRNYNVIFGD